ncbi:ABC transporter substrate-binding protein [Loktanella sp. M215]|uniref:ABC transporter substrate-binding protein n=1 Tax=Loktanella sp. M215 TaxID=2675431 RepID=UPI001F2CC10D|nr:ABC transporter substrate-binding protein [Loktanella sp. M215]MCF7701241.1 ABC transporter substrate-binding protein [Loktanella sp. M215]
MKTPAVLTLSAMLMLTAAPLFAADLKIGLAEDPDILDPDQSRTFVGRIVYASLCDKLVDITPDLEIIPMLATEWSWSEDNLTLTMKLRDDVTFQDGTPFDAEAVAYNINRSQTLEESRRKSEVASITGTKVVDPTTIEITVAQPDATLIAQLADRAGMMVSPTAAEAAGADFGNAPVCAGPYSFTERVQQDRIVLTKFADYYDADKYNFDTVTFLPIVDTTVRLANLRAGDVDMIERLAATDVASVKADDALTMEQATSLGYQGLTVNVANGDKAQNPFGQDKLVRQALSLSIDREAINQVVFEGAFAAGNQPWPPTSPWYDQDIPIPARDVEAAKAKLAEAGVESPTVEIQVSTDPVAQQVTQVIQAMAAEAGITVNVVAKEFATQLSQQTAGDYEISQIGWSGRVDPDGNIHQFVTCEGGINDAKYCNPEVDKLLNDARATNDTAERKALYDQATAILDDDLPLIYIYHQNWIWAMDKGVTGFTAYPDGMIRLAGVSKAE